MKQFLFTTKFKYIMNNHQIFKINFSDNELIITHCTDQRIFTYLLNQIDTQFNQHGFKKLDARTIIIEKLLTFDFAYIIDTYMLTLNFEVINGNKSFFYSINLSESLPKINGTIGFVSGSVNESANTNDQLQKIIWQLVNNVNNLKARIDDKDEKINKLFKKIDLLECEILSLKNQDVW